MHALHKLTLSTSKMAEGVKEDVHFRRYGGEGGGLCPQKRKRKKEDVHWRKGTVFYFVWL